jgi:UDPglucose 6-dehydrogenase
MKICVVGTGYVGLVTGVCFAEMGNDVFCIDIDPDKIATLKSGKPTIYEPGLAEMMERNLHDGRLTFTTEIAEGIESCQVIFIAVGTPEDEDGSADLQHVLGVAKSIGKRMTDYRLIVTKSTVPVGTAQKVSEAVAHELELREVTIDYGVASNPEFLKEGSAVQDFMKPDRIVIGCDTERDEELLRELYAPFLRTNHPVIAMDVRSSEMTKYASNAMLATKISFINEIANICEEVGADVGAVRLGMGADSRIGYQFLFPGLGYGGSCFPKDVKALIHTAQTNGVDPAVLSAVDELNQRQKSSLARKILIHLEEANIMPDQAKVAVWGLAFKPNTDDVREAPSLTVIRELLESGVNVCAFDPVAIENTKRALGHHDGLTYFDCNYDALEGAHVLAICTEWGAFRRPDFERMVELMEAPVVFDGRNIFEPAKMQKRGFVYHCIGRRIN